MKMTSHWAKPLILGIAAGMLAFAATTIPAKAGSVSVGVTFGNTPNYYYGRPYPAPYPGAIWVPAQRCYDGNRYYWRQGYYRPAPQPYYHHRGHGYGHGHHGYRR